MKRIMAAALVAFAGLARADVLEDWRARRA